MQMWSVNFFNNNNYGHANLNSYSTDPTDWPYSLLIPKNKKGQSATSHVAIVISLVEQ